MKRINDILEKILQISGISKNQFAKDLGLSRSYVVSVINGQKAMSENMYEKIRSLDYIPDEQWQLLKEAFYLEKFGETNFSLILHFISCAKQFDKSLVPDNKCDKADFPLVSGGIDNLYDIIKTAEAIFIQAKLNNETVYSNYSFCDTLLNDALFSVCKGNDGIKSLNFDHIVYASPTLNLYDIDIYWQSLRWGFAGIETKAVFGEKRTGAFPYYIVAGANTLIFSENLKNGLLFIDCDFSKTCIDEHISLSESAFPVISIIQDEVALLSNPAEISNSFNYVLDSTLCPELIFDYDILMKYTHEAQPLEFRDMLIRGFLNYYNHMSVRIRHSFLCENAIDDWLKNGRLRTVSDKYLKAFEYEDRKIIINRFYELKSGSVDVLPEKSIVVPLGYNIDINNSFFVTHYLFEPSVQSPYEIFSIIPVKKIANLYTFCNDFFKFISDSEEKYDSAQAKFLFEQKTIEHEYPHKGTSKYSPRGEL